MRVLIFLACSSKLLTLSRSDAFGSIENVRRRWNGDVLPAVAAHHCSICGRSLADACSFNHATYARMLRMLPRLVLPPATANNRVTPCSARIDCTVRLPRLSIWPPRPVSNDSASNGTPIRVACRVTTKATQIAPGLNIRCSPAHSERDARKSVVWGVIAL